MKFRYIWFRLSLTFILLSAFFQVFAQNKHCIVIHGGAGVMDQGKMPESRQKEYLLHLKKALMKGDSVLRYGGTSMDAVITAVVYLEDCPLFNAGKGAVFTWEGNIELDASVMDGST
jgi:beta-aspartyl-peptidase (threonine type)